MKEGDNLAITKIWAVNDDLNRVLNYIKNPDKTTELGDGLKEVLAYTTQGYKTNEKEYITGINCDPKTSLKQMMNTKLSYNKMDGRLAFHAVQSFKPGEVTPEKCHALGVQLAKQMWGNRFEVVVSTHLDKEHLHNHFVINSVSWVDGMKYDNRKSDIDHFRELNDAICKEHGLSIIENPSSKAMNYGEWNAEKKDGIYFRKIIRYDVDTVLSYARTLDQFKEGLEEIGYQVDLSGKHWTLKHPQSKRTFRFYKLTRDNHYDEEHLVDTLNKMFLISGNNTGTGILQNLMDSDGTGLICESEADTISTAIGSEYGHWSDTMRKAFDHDRLSYNRRTDHEYREVKKTYLSVLLSGTPSQVKPLIPTAENGLFSRQVFYYMPAIHHWQNQFDRNDSDLEDTFKALGMEWKDKLKTIVMNGIFTLHLTDGQKDEFNRLFSRLFVRSGLANGNEMSSSVARLAINICRIMEVVAMLRAMEQGEITASPYVSPDPHTATDNLKDHIVSRWDLLIASDDFHAVLSLAESLYRHTTHILSFLPNTEVTSRGNADRDALVDSMEEEFTRASFLQKAGEMGIKSETASTWLKRMQKHGLVENVDGKGNYRKPKV